MNKKQALEEPRQPEEDFVSFLIKNQRPQEEPRQPEDDFVSCLIQK